MLILPAIHKSTRSRVDKTWDLTFNTNEVTPQQVSEMVKSNQEYVWLCIKINEFKSRDLEIISGIESEFEFSQKPPSQRLRAVLYRMWENNPEGYQDCELHYRFHMEKIITIMKNKLP